MVRPTRFISARFFPTRFVQAPGSTRRVLPATCLGAAALGLCATSASASPGSVDAYGRWGDTALVVAGQRMGPHPDPWPTGEALSTARDHLDTAALRGVSASAAPRIRWCRAGELEEFYTALDLGHPVGSPPYCISRPVHRQPLEHQPS